MPKTRQELDAMLQQLEDDMPRRLKEGEDAGDFDFGSFADVADDIKDLAGGEDRAYVAGRIDCILGAAGLIPSENEGESCSPDKASTGQ